MPLANINELDAIYQNQHSFEHIFNVLNSKVYVHIRPSLS